jgi:hypothetical protein
MQKTKWQMLTECFKSMSDWVHRYMRELFAHTCGNIIENDPFQWRCVRLQICLRQRRPEPLFERRNRQKNLHKASRRAYETITIMSRIVLLSPVWHICLYYIARLCLERHIDMRRGWRSNHRYAYELTALSMHEDVRKLYSQEDGGSRKFTGVRNN